MDWNLKDPKKGLDSYVGWIQWYAEKEGINVQLTVHITDPKVIIDEQYQTFLLLEEPQVVRWTKHIQSIEKRPQ